jgi:hypothetical protein
MFGSAVLETAVGIIFVFLLVSLICTEVGNGISNLLRWRAIELENGIRDLILQGDSIKLRALYDNPLIQALTPRAGTLQQWIVKLPWIKERSNALPVNIPPSTFVLALFNTFVPNSVGKTTVTELCDAVKLMPESPLKRSLLAFVTAKNDQIDTVRQNVEEWFNGAMGRVSDSYKRNMWRLALVIGIAVSIGLNVDVLSISSNLWRDPTLRAAVTTAAERYEAGQQAPQAQQVLYQLNLPIGWQLDAREGFPGIELFPKDWVALPPDTSVPMAWILKLFGWLITGMAAAQGAPFWFDLLKKLTNRG